MGDCNRKRRQDVMNYFLWTKFPELELVQDSCGRLLRGENWLKDDDRCFSIKLVANFSTSSSSSSFCGCWVELSCSFQWEMAGQGWKVKNRKVQRAVWVWEWVSDWVSACVEWRLILCVKCRWKRLCECHGGERFLRISSCISCTFATEWHWSEEGNVSIE